MRKSIKPHSSQGVKHDAGKPRMTLLDPEVMREIANVLTFGANKYEDHNWRRGILVSRTLDAAERHIASVVMREHEGDLDTETGLHHLAHAMCELMFAMWTLKHKPEWDDRWKS